MIVCFCVTSNEDDIATAIDDGAHTVDQIGERCGAGTGCGSCRDFLQAMIDRSGARCPGQGQCVECPGSRQDAPRFPYGSPGAREAA